MMAFMSSEAFRASCRAPAGGPANGWRWGGSVAVVLDERVVLGVGGRPLVCVRLERALGAQERSAGGQGDQFRGRGPPVVVHPLRVFGVADQGAQEAFPLNIHLVAVDWDQGDIAALPGDRLQHFRAGQDVLRDLVRGDVAGAANDRDLQLVEQRLVGLVLVGPDHLAVRQGQDLAGDFLALPVLGDLDIVAIAPGFAQVVVAQRFPIDRLGALVPLGEGVLLDLVVTNALFQSAESAEVLSRDRRRR
jgi:hypothetical protein